MSNLIVSFSVVSRTFAVLNFSDHLKFWPILVGVFAKSMLVHLKVQNIGFGFKSCDNIGTKYRYKYIELLPENLELHFSKPSLINKKYDKDYIITQNLTKKSISAKTDIQESFVQTKSCVIKSGFPIYLHFREMDIFSQTQNCAES